MNKFYIITYDLKVPGRDYASLYSAIRNSAEWQHPLESVWLVYTSKNANTLYNEIRPSMDNSDLLFIAEIDPIDRQGWMAKSCWEWMNSKITK